MLTLAIALALASAVIHATWNVLLKTSGDPLVTSARAVGSSAIITTPVAVAAWLLSGRPAVTPAAGLLALASGTVELIYFILLSAAYRRGDLSLVYPIARGTAPILAALSGILLLGNRLTVLQSIGVVGLLLGVWLARRPVGAGPAVLPAIFTGVAIATYSTIDTVGVHNAPPWLFGWLMWVWTGILLGSWVKFDGWSMVRRLASNQRKTAFVAAHTEVRWGRPIAIGLMIAVAYLMVLTALGIAPLAVVSPVRESAIVLVAAWGIWRLREREELRARLVGLAAIVTGTILVALD